MMSKINYRWLLPIICLYTLPLYASECDSIISNEIVKNNHIQKRTEERITINKALATQIYSGERITTCEMSDSVDLKLVTNTPYSSAPARYFNDINGAPAYYLNNEYAYSIKTENNLNFTSQGEKLSLNGNKGSVALPNTIVTIYATVENPKPLSLSSAQIGSIKNSKNETIMKLMLSANIETVDTCVIDTKNIYFKFNKIDNSELPRGIGITPISSTNTLSLSCTDNRITKSVSMILNSNSKYADNSNSIIASDNPSIGFVLFYNDKQITHQTETVLGSINNRYNPQLVAYLYKLTKEIKPGAFSGSVEYTIKFN